MADEIQKWMSHCSKMADGIYKMTESCSKKWLSHYSKNDQVTVARDKVSKYLTKSRTYMKNIQKKDQRGARMRARRGRQGCGVQAGAGWAHRGTVELHFLAVVLLMP
jgi:uncharacterized coiled-coil DUF342 family protein